MILLKFTAIWFVVYAVILVLIRLFPIRTKWLEEVDGRTMVMTKKSYMLGSIPRVIATVITIAMFKWMHL